MEEEGSNDRWVDDPIYGLSRLDGRALDSLNNNSPILTSQELYILRVIALVAASISLISGFVVGWWFVRMKRSFRHHLIMLLVFSDFFKASWQLIYPAVVFTNGAVSSTSRFCQAAGFFMSMGIEASDFAVLVIAVHSALYIFRPGLTAIGEGGLYRYRHSVYVAWLAFSILMPSLAYVNSTPAYTAQGTFCYLPVRPFWYRMALAWIPRYVILVVILIIYASIYIYVRMKFRTFRSHVGASTLEMDTADLVAAEQPKPNNGQVPALDDHGLIPVSPSGDSRQASNSSDQPFAKALIIPQTIAEKLNFSPCNSEPRGSTCDGNSSSPSRRGSLPMSVSNMDNSNNTRGGGGGGGGNQDARNARLRGRRIAISRQLRLLFIYPLVYALMWVLPLISHLLQYQDKFVKNPSFPLACMVAFTIPVQCAVDCWLFTIREKPWRYIPKSDGKWFWSRYGFFAGEEPTTGRNEGDGWRKKKNMSFEARKAYERREEERREAAEVWLTRQEEKGRRPPMPRRSDTNWWDIVDNGDIAEESEEEMSEVEPRGRIDELGALEDGRGPMGEEPPSNH
ncbi:family A G protein-coupled receptor-like protein [Morchella conica CCBAS932]|uniref:Family A G protein-coupled receptor-like protein n=1 Tax=Morchella conica CCBAS932 TaxID=1392247 RepID=A0A3N4KJ07_9PEZI|nr:family A G protein-coupled receptor-like protein [Morchella conica CCBAS932]